MTSAFAGGHSVRYYSLNTATVLLSGLKKCPVKKEDLSPFPASGTKLSEKWRRAMESTLREKPMLTHGKKNKETFSMKCILCDGLLDITGEGKKACPQAQEQDLVFRCNGECGQHFHLKFDEEEHDKDQTDPAEGSSKQHGSSKV